MRALRREEAREEMRRSTRTHLPFALVLSGGGARGLAHAGVLHALAHDGYQPSAIVGVSMGAVVGVTYGLNPDWYRALREMDTSAFPQPFGARRKALAERFRAGVAFARLVRDMVLGWGVGDRSLPAGSRLLHDLTRGDSLERSRVPVAVVATDLISGERVVFSRGNAAEAAYASSALAGILPPLAQNGMLLADGAYADNAPVDVARELVPEKVLAIDVGQPSESPPHVHNGAQALARALEICHTQHAHLLFERADLVLRPTFARPIQMLDFDDKRDVIAAGVRAVRSRRATLARMLEATAPAPALAEQDASRVARLDG